jgi:exopolysaccharide production protein ExoQ
VPPSVALFVWFALLVALFRFDPAKHPGSSLALWIPLTWMFIVGSRLPSQWFGLQVGSANQALENGNPVDRAIFFVLIVLAVAILMIRGFDWGGFFARNIFLIAFLFFALVSVLWSDFPFISFKRWFRDLGNYLVILIAVSDPNPLEATRTLLRRFCYLLVPLSVLLIKYFPFLARQYDAWSGNAQFVGAATSKNMLGAVCLISGIFFFWDTVTRWPDRKERRTKRILQVNAILMLMTLWLLHLSSSATSKVCLIIGCLVILAANRKKTGSYPGLLKIAIPVVFSVYLILAFGLGLNGQIAAQLGRDPTLTDRTIIWNTLLSLHTNPVIGTGYESLWLGPRLQRIWEVVGGINEAHNGYLDIYLNLGFVGIVFLVAFLLAGYGTIWKKFATSHALAALCLAVWTVMLFYNVTEVAFKGGLLWLAVLLGAIAVPARSNVAVTDKSVRPAIRRLPRSPVELAAERRRT